MLAALIVLASVAYVLPYPPAPGPESWGFRGELARMETKPFAEDGRVPWLRHRISRCYFSPIKRPPFNRDELADDVDYYPEPYLKRLQSERINGLWITVEFGDLVGDAKRLSKLRATVERCARYGIRIWLFAIEPKAVAKDDPRFRESPDLFPCPDPWHTGRRIWCASDPRTLAYLHESVRDVFRAVPGLGGMLSITHGERCCSCFSRCDALDDGVRTPCPVCAKKKPWQLHHALADALVRGMREANPSAELLSWFYMPYASPHRARWVAEAAKHLPDGVTLLVNFESGIVREQLGRPHIGGDYWLSVAGPSGPFAEVAAAARSAGMPFGAKIQVGCSHEDATLPFVPVPGLLYRKYKAMREAGCSSVLQCWYFGNHPGLMNKAAGELAFSDFSESEEEFLLRLARDDWGEHAAEVAAIWEALTEAYSDYPLSNTVQYFGPFHAGVVWPLEPDLELNPLMPTWVCKPDPSGDAVGECLGDHTLAEALELSRRMSARCAGLTSRLEALAKAYAGDRERLKDIGVMRALVLQFAAAHDIFDFYAARAEAVRASRVVGDAAVAVRAADRMAAAVRRERAVTEAMLPICRADSRIGFHSEAEAHQFFPARLEWRLATLDRARIRLDEISRELAAGRPYPLSDWERTAPTCPLDGSWTEGKGLRFRLTPVADGQVRLEAAADADGDFIVCAYDAAGTVFPQERIVRMKGRKGELTLPLAADDRLLVFGKERPMVWPHPGEDLPYRLSIGHAWARSCGRCVKKGKGDPR